MAKNLFVHIDHKSWLDKKGFTCKRTGFVSKEKSGKVSSQKKRFYITKKQELQTQKFIKTGFT